jgi:hypothetical protein
MPLAPLPDCGAESEVGDDVAYFEWCHRDGV